MLGDANRRHIITVRYLRRRSTQFEAKDAEHQQHVEMLRLREQEINALLGIAPQPVIARFDRQLRHIYVHTAVKLATGIPPQTYVGKTSREMGTPEPVVSLLEDALKSVFATGEEKTIEYSVTALNQTWFFESRLIPAFDANHKVDNVLTLTREVSHQKQAEEALVENFQILETVNRVGKILSAELELKALVQAVTDIATELTRAEIGAFFYNVQGESGESYTLYTISGVPEERFKNYPMPRNTELFGPTFRGEGTIRIDNVRQDPRYGKNSPYTGVPEGHFPVVSYLAVPVLSQTQKVLGGLFFGHSKPGIFTERDARVVEGLAAQAAIAMDNARLYQEVQQQEKRLQVTLASIGDAVITTNAEGEISFMNGTAEQLTGWNPPDALGKPSADVFYIVNEVTREPIESPVTGAIHEKKEVRLSRGVILLARDGRELYIDSTGAPMFDESKVLRGVVLVFRDITKQRQNEQRLNLLLDITAGFSQALTLNHIADVVIRRALKPLGAHIGTIFLLDNQGQNLEILATYGLSPTMVEKYQRFPLDFSGPLNDAVRTNNIVWIETMEQYVERYPLFADAIQRQDSHSTVCIPLKVHERVIGGLSISFRLEKRPNASEEEFFLTLAQLCAQALERARLYEAASEMHEMLQFRVKLESVISELGQEALVSFDMPAFMNKVALSLAQTLQLKYAKILELLPEENSLLLRAGVGWGDGLVGHAKVDAAHESQAGFALQSHVPVIVEDLVAETRFQPSELFVEHQIVSGISVRIGGHQGAWGVLGVHSVEPRTFTSDDIYFVQSVANILGAALERAKLDALLVVQSQRLANIIATVPGVIWENHHTDEQEEMKLVFISDYLETMLGYTAEEALAEPHFWIKIFHPDDAQKTVEMFNRVRQSGGSGVVHFRAISKSGQVIDIQALMITILKDGKPIGKRGVMMDVSERQNLLNTQMKYAAMLRRSNEELERFAYVASHDLQEPLRMVTSFLQLLESQYAQHLDADAHEFINFAVDGAKRMKTLIQDLLAYSRIQNNDDNLSSFNSEEALTLALANLRMEIEEHQAQITYEGLPTIFGNKNQLAQVFQNLISNALKFRSEAVPCIRIAAHIDGTEWIFSVQDNGIGIETEYLERIFIMFRRLHPVDKYKGSGIGLAICKKVVEYHQGRIWADSSLGRGTTFYFTIPISRPVPNPDKRQ